MNNALIKSACTVDVYLYFDNAVVAWNGYIITTRDRKMACLGL